ncbi:GNAT family N-acetyltransferase [Flavobacterium capsici]|uniref:GNAT family N-acetyltransferase n=1 Tax=Flavobacterium capsici TaxID=3075618 RepID=A0AA96F2Y9_9FLAO|nr:MULTISPECIES: GNAT family N-acetyltransferase [unclassified Flavobacterium]WNM20347.1 GNAT family N-acetyltransferase [Flavobacterium sp. PMR2A8]WNM21737.1 GNAT family N-acetyltransferase [Flavobacterium sp. PMTSA4]
MEIKKLEWDSNFFGFPVGDLLVECETSDSKVFNSDFFTFFQVRSKYPLNIISETHSLSHWEIKTIFSKNLDKSSEIKIDIIDFDDSKINEKLLYELAYESGKFSRYKLDKNIPNNKFKKLYQLWIKNSVNKSFADKIFYYKENDDIAGFVTVKIKDTFAQIGLIAIEPNLQGKGIGKNLLLKVENYCLENNVKRLLIPTQSENEQACKFYTKMGYIISEEIIIKNYWKNNF